MNKHTSPQAAENGVFQKIRQPAIHRPGVINPYFMRLSPIFPKAATVNATTTAAAAATAAATATATATATAPSGHELSTMDYEHSSHNKTIKQFSLPPFTPKG